MPATPERTADAYRQRLEWDQVTWASHCGNCIANCTYRLYVRDGAVVWEEQAGTLPALDGIPDMNPLGCQKGAAWSAQLTGGERLLHPMRRVGERGSGSWERISWDEALDAVADAVIDAIESGGPHAVVFDEPAQGGFLGMMAQGRLVSAMGGASIDGTGGVSDMHNGHWITFGNISGGSSADDSFRSDVIVVWNANPAYTRIPYFHYLSEARYRGAHVVVIAPDYSPSSIHADWFVTVGPGTDTALALALCRVIIDEGLADLGFVRSQTDLPLLVKTSDRRYLRQSDMEAGGRPDRFYAWLGDGPVPVDHAHLDDPADPSPVDLEGRHQLRLADGTVEQVTTVFGLLRERLADYSPEQASPICGVHPDAIRRLARLVASGRTKLYNGLGSAKHYHGDLMERAMGLVLALTGNWGRPGSGFDTYVIALLEGELFGRAKGAAGVAATEAVAAAMDLGREAFMAAQPDLPAAAAMAQMSRLGAAYTPTSPSAFFLYYHGGFAELWDTPGYGDSPRPLSEHIDEALESGWWSGLVRPAPGTAPRVLFQAGVNTLRRVRGGQRQLLEHLWPSLDMVVVIDWRMNTVGLLADVVLPVTCEAEQIDVHAAASHSWERMFSDRALEPAGEARSDWQIFQGIARAISRRAAERGLETYADAQGGRRRYDDIGPWFTFGGALEDDEAALDEFIRDSAFTGNLPAGTSLASLRQTGWVRPERLSPSVATMCGSDLSHEGPFVGYRDRVEKGEPFATLTGRAQFYVDHPWFLEADEQLPVHKDPPKMGGDHPLQLTGGHPRWSIHANNTTSRLMLETTRGKPVVHLNPTDAAARGVADDDWVRLFNDLGDLHVSARVAAAVRPGQVILYGAWEAYLFPGWRDVTFVEPGVVKWLQFAGGWGHLGYSPLSWQPTQPDRCYRVDVEKARGGGDGAR